MSQLSSKLEKISSCDQVAQDLALLNFENFQAKFPHLLSGSRSSDWPSSLGRIFPAVTCHWSLMGLQEPPQSIACTARLETTGQSLQPLPQAGQTQRSQALAQVCSAPKGSEQYLALCMSLSISFSSLAPSQAPKHDLTSEYRLQPLPWPPGSFFHAESVRLHWQKGRSSKIHKCRDA